MQNYLLLCEKIKEIKKEYNHYISNTILSNYENNSNFKNLSKETITYNKDNFIFKTSIIEKKIPTKYSDRNHLNYNMKKQYCSCLFIYYMSSHISIILSYSNSLCEENFQLSKWNDFILNSSIDDIFKLLLNKVES